MATYKSFAITVPGITHPDNCQDYSCSVDLNEHNASIIVVADGHGDTNCFRSKKGALLAATLTRSRINEFIKYHKDKFGKDNLVTNTAEKVGIPKKKPTPDELGEKQIRDLIRHIIMEWHDSVEKDYLDPTNPKGHNFTDDELDKVDDRHKYQFVKKEDGTFDGAQKAYGTTLIASAITPHYWFGIHIGDGRFTALYPDGKFDQPVPWDEDCNLNVTTSICNDNAFEHARCYFSFIDKDNPKPPCAVFLCSDGIDDNYPVEENEVYLFKEVYRRIVLSFAKGDFESTRAQVERLANRYANQGKGDDTSIAGFIDMEAVKNAADIWENQIEQEKKGADEAKAAEEAEKQAAAEKKAPEPAVAVEQKAPAEKAELDVSVKDGGQAATVLVENAKQEASKEEKTADALQAIKDKEHLVNPQAQAQPGDTKEADFKELQAAKNNYLDSAEKLKEAADKYAKNNPPPKGDPSDYGSFDSKANKES